MLIIIENWALAEFGVLLLILQATYNILLITVIVVLLIAIVVLFLRTKSKNKEIQDILKKLNKKDLLLNQAKEDLNGAHAQNAGLSEHMDFLHKQIEDYKQLNKDINSRLDEKVQKRTQELRKALEVAQESNRIKEAFLEKISREIRTPLNSILGFINLLNEPDLTKLDREYYFKFIRESGNNLLVLIDNIVDFSKIETGEFKIEERRGNLGILLGDLVEKYRNKMNRENPDLSIIFNRDEEVQDTKVDCIRTLHVIDQILNNAVKFTESGKVEVSYKTEGNYHVIAVSDTGIGIQKKYQDIIFERFYRVEQESREFFQGAGLGLTIAKGIIDLLNGQISVESELGKGTTFKVVVPFKPVEEDTRSQSTVEHNYDWSNKVILIAEDEDSNFHFLEAILKKTKVKILRAEDGVEFLELINANSNNIDLVLLDIKMPGINGFNAIKVIRQQNINTPVIAQTAFSQAEDKQKCLDCGCDDYLAKPIDKELLYAKISRFFNN